MHLNYMHPVTSENQFACTTLYVHHTLATRSTNAIKRFVLCDSISRVSSPVAATHIAALCIVTHASTCRLCTKIAAIFTFINICKWYKLGECGKINGSQRQISAPSSSPHSGTTTVCPSLTTPSFCSKPACVPLIHGEIGHLQYWDTSCSQGMSKATLKKSTWRQEPPLMNCTNI